MSTSSASRDTIRIFAAVALSTITLGACEDLSPPPKPRPPASVAPPNPEVIAPPIPVSAPPPQPPVEPETSKTVPVPTILTVDEETKRVDALTGARKMLEAGEPEKALKLANVAVLKMPKRSAAWNTLGRVQLQLGKRKDAIASFEKAIELNPLSSYAQNNLGLALIHDKRYDEAVDALLEAVELEPVEGYMWNNLGMAYEQLDRLEEARDAYAKAVELESDRAQGSLARLKGVKSVIRTAKVDTDKAVVPGTKDSGEKEGQFKTQ